MSANALSRAAFLTLAFPRIIARGRAWFVRQEQGPGRTKTSGADDAAVESVDGERDTNTGRKPRGETHGSAFDLAFLRYSCHDHRRIRVLVALLVFSDRSAHMWAAALILPLASGTAPACKGVLLDMVPAARKSDALSAIALVETTAMITTVSLYGGLFAFLSSLGHPNWVFVFNALTALMSAGVLFAVRFPRGTLVVR
ncbi:hypothetical protein C8R43DRAFT_1235320 [Mycena crocata]|nr:hypothetical protein C8R43DRAFT_1235320 [Mycena crocata]